MKKVLIVVLVVIMVLSIGVVGATAAGFGSDHGRNKACVNGVSDGQDVRSGQRIDCEHPQGGLAVDEDMGVLPLQRVQILPQDSLTAHGIYQGYFHTG